MSKIYGSLVVPAKDWRYIYNSVINYFNEEISVAYAQATEFYKEANTTKYDTYMEYLDTKFSSIEITHFRKELIRASTVKNSTSVVKPKKNFFQKFTNRTTRIDTVDLCISFDKNNHQIHIETSQFEDFDNYMATNSFISEFVNMVNCINWPSRQGPSKTIRGATLVKETVLGNKTLFYSAGPNPPPYEVHQVEVVDKPSYLEASAIKTIKLTSTTPEETSQPLPEQEDLTDI